ADGWRHRVLRRLLLQLAQWHELVEHLLRKELPVADLRKELVVLEPEVVRCPREGVRVEQLDEVAVIAPRLLLQHLASEFHGAQLLLALNEVLDLAARARRRDEVEPVAARLVTRIGDDLDD